MERPLVHALVRALPGIKRVGELGHHVPDASAQAAVLVPVMLRETGATVLLTRRTDHLHHHAGQISLPGGQTEAEDRSPIDTALREAREETGLDPVVVDVLGTLPCFTTLSGFSIVPVVGLIRGEAVLSPDPFEVAALIEIPLEQVLRVGVYQRHRMQRPEGPRFVYGLAYRGSFVWGATAAILHALAEAVESA